MFESHASENYFLENSVTDDVNIFTSLRKHANRVLDDFILALGSSRKQNETIHTVMEGFCQEMDHCLIKIKSLPPTSLSIGLELGVTYNLLYAAAMKAWYLQHKLTDVLLSKASTVMLSLQRVHEVLGVDKCQQEQIQQPCKTELEKVSFVLVSILTSLKALDNKVLGQEVGMLTCMCSLISLLDRDPSPFSSCLSIMSDWTLLGDEIILKHGFLRMSSSVLNLVKTERNNGSKSCGLVQNFSSLLLAVSYFHELKHKECRDFAAKVDNPEWKWFSTLLTAQALLADGNSMEAVGVLHTALDGHPDTSSPVSAQIYRLLASCYSAQQLPHLAVLMLQRCLQIEPGSTAALFMLAQQFQSLQQGNDETECLQVLVKAAEENSASKDRQGIVHPPLLEHLLQEAVVCPDRLSMPQALYHLAVRSEQLKKYEESSKAYEKLIHRYQRKESISSQLHSQEVFLPDLLTVCREAAQVYLKIPEYKHCLQLCDRVLNAISSSSLTSPSDSPRLQPFEDLRSARPDESFTISQGDVSFGESDPVSFEFKSGRKRCWSSSSSSGWALDRDDKVSWKNEENRILLMMCKAECLLNQEDKPTAVQVLNWAFQGLMECRQKVGGQRLKEGESAWPRCSASDPKRPCYSSSQVKATATETPLAVEEELQDQKFHQLSSRLCLYLADALCRCDQHQQALHSARLAAQAEPESEVCQYFLNNTLMKLGRGQEGYQSWLLVRGLPHNTNSTHLQSAVQQRKDMIRNVPTDSSDHVRRLGVVTERQKLELDLSSLELLVKSRTKR